MQRLLISALSILAVGTAFGQPSAKLPEQLEVCKDTDPDCKRPDTLGSVAVSLNYDQATATPVAKEPIEKELSTNVKVPNEPGQTLGYWVIPKEGDAANKKIFVAFHNHPRKPGTLEEAGTYLSIFKQFEGDSPDNWHNFVTYSVPGEKITFKETPLTIRPDGTAVFVNPKTGTPEVFDLARKRAK